MLASVKETKTVGTVTMTLVEIADGRVWTVALHDTFRHNSAFSFQRKPSEAELAGVVAMHVHQSQGRTQRN